MISILPRSLTKLISEFEKLPGIGPKSAARLAYHLLRAPRKDSEGLANAALELKSGVVCCSSCYCISDSNPCAVCANESRDRSIICVVEDPLDVLAIEKVSIFDGLYHVLGGVISPVHGIGPDELRINELIERLAHKNDIKELILGTNPNLEGEATAMYILKKVTALNINIKVSRIARGLPTGADLEYADSLTLKRSFEGRVNFNS